MKRVRIDFKERRSISKHETQDSNALEWIKIWNADEVYFDGERKHGYGGYTYDGRWKEIVSQLILKFDLNSDSSLLDLGCAKGFLVNDFNNDDRVGSAEGVDLSLYALIEGIKENINGKLTCANFTHLPFENNEFSLVFCKDSLHNILSKDEVIKSLKEIDRVGELSWIRVGAFKTKDQKNIIDNWATFATTYLHQDEWLELFKEAKYSGFYDWFHPSEII